MTPNLSKPKKLCAKMAEVRTRWVTTAGDLSNLRMKTEAIPEPGANEVQISVEAVGFNFADLFACLGLYRYPKKYPKILYPSMRKQ